VKSQSALNSEIDTNLPSGQANTAVAVRGILHDIVNSSAILLDQKRVDITAYGGKGDNLTDNTPAYNAAIAGFPASTTGKCIYFPAGKYLFSTTPNTWSTTSSTDSLVIVGDGAEATELTFPTVGIGFNINLQSQQNSIHFKDFSITTGTAGASGGYAIQVNQGQATSTPGYGPVSEISGIAVRGNGGYSIGPNYWTTGVIINGLNNINWIGDIFHGPGPPSLWQTLGTGVIVQGTSSTFPVAHNFIGSTFNLLGTGVVYGNYTQGLAFTSCNFTGVTYGIRAPPGLVNQAELAVVGCQFNAGGSNGGGVRLESSMSQVTINGSTFYMDPANSVGIALEVGIGGFSIINNVFVILHNGSTNNGVAVQEAVTWSSVISGNVFYNSDSTPAGTGIFLQSGSTKVLITGNTFSNLGNNIVNSGTNHLIYGNYPEYLYTIASLPTPSAALIGQAVKISNGVASPTYNAAVGTTGSTISSVLCDGASWRYH
jgi:hypothetical protein